MQLLEKHEEEIADRLENITIDIAIGDAKTALKNTRELLTDLTKNNRELESTQGELSNDYKVEKETE